MSFPDGDKERPKEWKTRKLTQLEITQEHELEFLRFFYHAAGGAFGCAGDDIYNMIKEDYAHQGGILPNQYKEELEE